MAYLPVVQPTPDSSMWAMTTERLTHSTSRRPERPAAANPELGLAPTKTHLTAGGLETARSELARLRRSSRLDIKHRLREARSDWGP